MRDLETEAVVFVRAENVVVVAIAMEELRRGRVWWSMSFGARASKAGKSGAERAGPSKQGFA